MASDNAEDNPSCTPLWGNLQRRPRRARRLAYYYYSNTIDAVGVSRLRIAHKDDVPAGGIVAAFEFDDDDGGDESSSDNDNNGYFVAFDLADNLFFPVVCQYADGAGAKIFLVEDPEAGIDLLQSSHVVYSFHHRREGVAVLLDAPPHGYV